MQNTIAPTPVKYISDHDKNFVLNILHKYTDYTGNPHDGLRASHLCNLVVIESNNQIHRGKVKAIMESLDDKFKQRFVFYGHPHYCGLKLKDIYSNIFTY